MRKKNEPHHGVITYLVGHCGPCSIINFQNRIGVLDLAITAFAKHCSKINEQNSACVLLIERGGSFKFHHPFSVKEKLILQKLRIRVCREACDTEFCVRSGI